MPHSALVIGATSEFLTIKALGTFAGASTATIAVGNGLRYLLRRDVLWLPFVTALVFSAVQAQIVGADWSDVSSYALVVVNGFLLFFTALGANQIAVSAGQPEERARMKAQGRKRPKLLGSWL